jgi:phasin family protein
MTKRRKKQLPKQLPTKQTLTEIHPKEHLMPALNNPANDLAFTLTKACEDMKTMTESYVSATAKSNAAAMQGVEDLTRNLGALTQETFTRMLAAFTTMASAKSPQEAAETHADFLKDSFDQLIAGGTKLSELSIRTTQSAIDPLAQHANDAMGNLMKKAKTAA